MKTKISLILLLISLQLSAGWEPFSPEGINANRIRFYVDNSNHWAVCHDGGIYLYDLNNQTWTNYGAILPIVDAAWLDGENIMVIMNGGLMEDGVHYLNPGTATIYALKYLETPHFIKYNAEEDRYYVGHRFGIKYTDNIVDWHDLEFFNNKDIVDMDIFGNHYVVSEMDNLYNVYYSDDAGLNWQTASNPPMISDLEFDYTGKLYGVFPDESWSSGLWSSNDFGANWNVEFWFAGMYCVGLDAAQDVFVGFHETQPLNEGIARWDSLSQNLYYMNAGLPDLMINQITYNPAMSAMALFCCTQNGAYINYDYVGIPDKTLCGKEHLEVYPNPADEVINIRFSVEGKVPFISIFSSDGKLLEEYYPSISSGKMQFDCSGFVSGMYYIVMKGDHSQHVRKIIKLNPGSDYHH